MSAPIEVVSYRLLFFSLALRVALLKRKKKSLIINEELFLRERENVLGYDVRGRDGRKESVRTSR